MKVFTVTVHPGSKRDVVEKVSSEEYKISTVAPAKEGKANKMVIKLLANHLKVSASKLLVTKGERWNTKTILQLE